MQFKSTTTHRQLRWMFALKHLVMVLFASSVASRAIAADQPEIEFNRDIRSLLSDNCFSCHGPDKHGRQADLRLDERSSAIESGAIVPGSATTSSVLERIRSTDPDQVMPPPKTGKSLTAEQVERLARWIDGGAEYQSHWAFLPVPKTVAVPDGEASVIDRFLAKNFQRLDLQPSPPADKMRWLRRVTLDLTGLPPTIQDMEAFEQDASATAYERVVDRLLVTDGYGERMANMWLDVARYADTFGYQADVEMQVWPWRDWVIRAFNSNLPFDQFITWQVAGDLLPNPTMDQRLATTFNRLHRQTNEGGSVEEEFRQIYVADRTVTAGTAFLGLTLECSRCHDHKYDPILQTDFYQLSSYFANIDEHGLYSHFTSTAPTPAMLLYSGDQEQRHSDLLRRIGEAEKGYLQTVELAHKAFVAGERSVRSDANEPNASSTEKGRSDEKDLKASDVWPVPVPEHRFPLDGAEPGRVGNATRCNGDDAIDCPGVPSLTRTEPFSFSLWLQPVEYSDRAIIVHQSVAAEDSAFRGMQLVLSNGRPQFSLIHFWPGNAIRVESVPAIPLNEWSQIGVTYDGSSHASGIRVFINGEQVATTIQRDQLTRDFQYRAAWGDSNGGKSGLAIGARFRDIGFRNSLVDDLQVFLKELSSLEMASLFVDSQPDQREKWERNGLPSESMKWDFVRLRNQESCVEAYRQLQSIRKEEDALVSQVPQIMTMRSALLPRKTFVLGRGAYDAPQAEVQPDLPSAIARSSPRWASTPLEQRDRLQLARWLTADENPLTSRVTVNRFWHLFFGRGIVASLEDFGSQGTPPTHPELLDWIARDFMDHGWDAKRLCKQIVLSDAYRRNSQPANADVVMRDPDNKWLARGPRHRLSAEQVRDAALAVSGLLVPSIGGPSVKPYQPAGLWEEAGTGKSYSQSSGAGLYRRSLYTFWRRTAPPPSMLTFDATSRETCTAKRDLTTTPLQALVLQNDPQYIEASRVLADQLVGIANLEERWQRAFRMMLTRSPSTEESRVVQEAYDEQRAYFASDEEAAMALIAVGEKPRQPDHDAIDLAATTIVVNMILCYDEFFMKR